MITSRDARRAAGWLAGLRKAGTAGRVATAVIAAAIVAGGCAAVPTSGAVQQVGGAAQAGNGQEQEFSQPIPVGPGPGWSAEQIVAGFLAANASFANDHAVARKYLDSTAQRAWRPGWAVTVVSNWTASPASFPRQFAASQPGGYTNVRFTGLKVATLSATGQSLPTSGTPRTVFPFTLFKINGQWRIHSLPSELLLTQSDFQHVYQPRDLYFLAGSGRTLVPDPVFVPQQDTNTELAKGLVTALLQNPKGWLGGAAVTRFPPGTSLIGDVKINGPNAVVNLGGEAAVSRRQQMQMAAQLAWTLATGPTAIQSVEVEVNGRPLQIAGNDLQLPQAYRGWVPTVPAASSLYLIGSNRTVRAMSGIGEAGSGEPSVTAVPGAAGASGVPALISIAVSPDGRFIAGIGAGRKVVYIGSLSHGAVLREGWKTESGGCTSLSWDRSGDLWITAGGNVWMLAPGQPGASQIALPPTDSATAFRVAPDGVRAVMIVNDSQMQLVAITRSGSSATLGDPVTIGTGISDPEALSWYDANHVIVLAGGSSGSQLEEVPLNGGQPIPIAADSNIVSVAAMSPGGSSPDIAVGLSNGQIMVSSNLGAFENTHATGEAPVFPG